MAIYLGTKNLKEIFYGSTRIIEARLGGALLWQYDKTAPTLTVTAPASESSSSPTYVTAASYTVRGTVSDAGSGVKSVTVNGKAATINGNNWSCAVTLTADAATTITVVATDNAGQTTTVTRYAFYESANPTVAVTAPIGTSSSDPTYYQSDSAVNYKVYGTASAKSGIKSVTVGGEEATGTTSWSYTSSRAANTTHTITIVVTSNAGRTTTITRYLRVEAYYQYAARLAGTTVQTSLADTLTNSTVCQAIAGNSTAYGIMKSNYSSTMKSYIDNSSYWNAGLNYLNYKCSLKCYLLHSGDICSLITGGWTASNKGYVTNGTAIGIDSGSGSNSTVYTTNAISGSFTNIYFYATSLSGEFKFGIAEYKNTDTWKQYNYSYSGTANTWYNAGFTSGYYPQIRISGDSSSYKVTITNVYIE